MGVEADFHSNLLGRDLAMFDGIGFVDELDSEHGSCFSGRDCLFNSERSSQVIDSIYGAGLTDEAYAPLPIVFDMIRKGRLLGRGSS